MAYVQKSALLITAVENLAGESNGNLVQQMKSFLESPDLLSCCLTAGFTGIGKTVFNNRILRSNPFDDSELECKDEELVREVIYLVN